ncbi:MAG: 4Fe-4S dicluster domain-containing protein [Dehalococcoidia bacterium]|nr:4Fe-4S dicluster domain-containing protein [Dehalococcoidia bacterium]
MATTMLLTADAKFCDGCRMCELVCSLNKTGRVNPYMARIRVVQSPAGAPRPIICWSCPDAKCQTACSVPGAIYVEPHTGALVIDESKCTRCLDCVIACPFKAIQVGPAGEILKCDLCGGDPLCVQHCPYRPANSLPSLPYPKQSCLKYVERKK